MTAMSAMPHQSAESLYRQCREWYERWSEASTDLVAVRSQRDRLESEVEVYRSLIDSAEDVLRTANTIHKVRWWSPEWKKGRDGARVRYYGPGHQRYALERVAKLAAKGYIVELEVAPVGSFEDAES